MTSRGLKLRGAQTLPGTARSPVRPAWEQRWVVEPCVLDRPLFVTPGTAIGRQQRASRPVAANPEDGDAPQTSHRCSFSLAGCFTGSVAMGAPTGRATRSHRPAPIGSFCTVYWTSREVKIIVVCTPFAPAVCLTGLVLMDAPARNEDLRTDSSTQRPPLTRITVFETSITKVR